MITVNQVVKRFDGFAALDGLTMTVPDGAIYGLVGPNGAGKTTLLRHLAGILWPDAGEVSVDRQDVFENLAVKSRVAWIPDDAAYFPQDTIGEMRRFYRGVYPSFDDELYEKLGQAFPLRENMQLRRLSRGMRKQVAFWMALCTRPDYLILDEPVDGLDPVMRRQVWSLLMDGAAAHGATVVVSSHNLRELEDVCDHVGIMNGGKMLLERSLAELQDNIVKVQLVTENPLPAGLDILHESATGRVRTLIIRGGRQEVSQQVAATLPIFFDLIPLSLEEIFIYELGGADYAVKSILL